MADQLATGADALRLFFTDDLFLVKEEELIDSTAAVIAAVAAAEKAVHSVNAAAQPAPTPAAPIVTPTLQAASPIPAVELPKEAVLETSAAPAFKYLGKNQKNVLILVHDERNETSTERGRELLRNIVKALQLTANDFALLNYAAYANTPFNTLTTFFSSKLVLSFGVAAAQLGLGEQGLNVLHQEGSVQLVFSQNLDLLAESQQDKKALWGSLKQIQLS